MLTFTVDGLLGNALRAGPRGRALHVIRHAVAGEGELAGIAALRALIDHATDRLGIGRVLGAVEDDLGDGQLTHFGFGTGLEIDGAGKAVLFRQLQAALGDLLLLLALESCEALVGLGRLSASASFFTALADTSCSALRLTEAGSMRMRLSLA
jgi:hypothetical protein